MHIATVLSLLLDFPVVQSVVTVPEVDISNKGTVSASVTCRVIYVSPREAVWSGGNNWAWMSHLLPAWNLSFFLCEVGL